MMVFYYFKDLVAEHGEIWDNYLYWLEINFYRCSRCIGETDILEKITVKYVCDKLLYEMRVINKIKLKLAIFMHTDISNASVCTKFAWNVHKIKRDLSI